MRGAPQVGFSATIRKIRARTSLLTHLRPPTCLALETQVQYKRNPARCQLTTGLGGRWHRAGVRLYWTWVSRARTACAGQAIDGEVAWRAELAVADGEPGFRGRDPPGN